jgi:hypothetical protein
MRTTLRRPAVLAPVIVIAIALIGMGLYLFQPWKLFTNVTVDEAAPVVAAAQVEPVVLAEGSFISHEHATEGSVRILELADGSRVLRIEDLDTSNGPDLKVWLTDAPVIEGEDGWYVFDDGAYVDLGALKGNQGSQNYALPADADLTSLTSVAIWCDRFSVSFGAAELTSAA